MCIKNKNKRIKALLDLHAHTCNKRLDKSARIQSGRIKSKQLRYGLFIRSLKINLKTSSTQLEQAGLLKIQVRKGCVVQCKVIR